MCLVGTAKPSKVITVCDEEDRAVVDPLVEELEIPRCVLVTSLCDAAAVGAPYMLPTASITSPSLILYPWGVVCTT